jgi:hypothetical protein
MNPQNQMLADLRLHQNLSRELLSLAEQESQALRHQEKERLREISDRRRGLLPNLNQSVATLRDHRQRWQTMSAAERAAQPEVGFLIRQTQDLIMRAILLDRENEQGLLRQGLIPPREIPAARPARPHWVANLYRRQ